MPEINVVVSQVPTVLNIFNISIEESVAKALHDKISNPGILQLPTEEAALNNLRDQIGVALSALNPLPEVP